MEKSLWNKSFHSRSGRLISLRLAPNSFSHGMTYAPKEARTPIDANSARKDSAAIVQPYCRLLFCPSVIVRAFYTKSTALHIDTLE